MDQTNDLTNIQIDYQSLLEYLSNVSSIMLEVNKDTIYLELQRQSNLELIKYFSADRNTKLLCITKSETEGTPLEFVVETDITYKGTRASSICFIKKENSNIEFDKSFAGQLQVMNLSNEGNDLNVFLFMQNYIQSAFSPLFNSYQNAIIGGQENRNIKSNTFQTVQNKMAELVFLLNQSQKNSDIPNVKIEADPELKARMNEIRGKGREPNVEDFIDKKDDEPFIMRLIDNTSRWQVDINSVLRLDRKISQGNALQEVNFWKDYETTLINSIYYLYS
jgi:hypothetical protein